MPFTYDPNKLKGADGKIKDISWRLRPPQIDRHRMSTGIADVDKILGGFPYGLTIFTGDAGTGKSKFIQTVVNKLAEKGVSVLYVFSESPLDVENLNKNNKNIHTANYFQYQPKWDIAIEEIMYLMEQLKTQFLVIDSITTLFSETTKAVDEADIRGAVSDLKKRIQNQIPVVGISQIRGSGYFTYAAGGKAVDHVADLLVQFSKVSGKSEAGKYEKTFGDYIWYINVQKDKTGMARQDSKYEVVYDNNTINLRVVD